MEVYELLSFHLLKKTQLAIETFLMRKIINV